MSLGSVKARFGSIPPSTLERVRQNSPASYRILTEDMPQLIAIADTVRSVLSEEGVKKYLSAYVMGIMLIDQVEDLNG